MATLGMAAASKDCSQPRLGKSRIAAARKNKCFRQLKTAPHIIRAVNIRVVGFETGLKGLGYKRLMQVRK